MYNSLGLMLQNSYFAMTVTEGLSIS